MINLTEDEIAFLEKIDKERKQHAEAQKKYRYRKAQEDPEYKQKLREYMKSYNEKKQSKYLSIKKKLLNEAQPNTIFLSSIKDDIKIDRRTKRGKRQVAEIIPSYQTRKTELKENTLNSYISKSDIIHRILTGKSLSPQLEEELLKLFNNEDFDENFIIDNMDYLNDIEPTISTIRSNYSNNNSFKSYVNVLTVITSHIPLYKDTYQILTKLNINLNKAIQDIREENKLEDYEKDKIIDLNRDVILKKLDLLSNIKDKLVFAVYTLQPARRLEWRFVVLTTETDEKKLEDPDLNFLSISPKGKKVIFNNYKIEINTDSSHSK